MYLPASLKVNMVVDIPELTLDTAVTQSEIVLEVGPAKEA